MTAPICYVPPTTAPSHGKAYAMASRFVLGWAAVTGQMGAILSGASKLAPGACVFYGVTPETLALYRQCVAERREYYYIDNGYFNSRYEGGSHYRVTRNAPQHSGVGVSDGKRWERLGLGIAPWQPPADDNAPVLVVLQSPFWHARHGEPTPYYIARITREISEHTGRPIVVRGKPGTDAAKEPPLDVQLFDAACVVTHSSNVGVKALLAGIPVVTTGPCAAATLSTPIAEIAIPRRPADPARLRWAQALADNQFTLDEIERGDCARALNGL